MTQGRIVAYLGPTNTGKTYLAVERMLGHRSGIIGLPLRLLARENYERIVALKGVKAVALITGEEKIVPAQAQYFICTVEAMPLDRQVECVAIDEIQLAAHAERGHVFTDRLLHARGLSETLFMGAETIRPLLQRLVPDVEIVIRPRLSTLTYDGYKRITRLPPRSAVVAFSANDVYALAESIRHQRGGTAVILGALSPRTRNAQMAMYQSGDVDYLVGTDAIGMGLNMDVDHVALARQVKFDGAHSRRLDPQEIAQIAGRAGRHMKNGTFGITDQLSKLDEETISAIETHKFATLKTQMWRNSDLDKRSVPLLLRSLEVKPPLAVLKRMVSADDHQALLALSKQPETMNLAQDAEAVSLLWDVCQIPDFRKTLSEAHIRLLSEIYKHLQQSDHLPEDFVGSQIARLDRIEGDIDTLVSRIAHIRTWTYVSHHASWLQDSTEWRERTRAIEDRLSDALHERLTQRFVDKRSALLAKNPDSAKAPAASIRDHSDVLIDGTKFGRIAGLRFIEEETLGEVDRKRVLDIARAALRSEMVGRVAEIIASPDEDFSLDEHGMVLWREASIIRLTASPNILRPQLSFSSTSLTSADQEQRLRHRIQDFLLTEMQRCLEPLIRLEAMDIANATLRGLVYSLFKALGTLSQDELSVSLKREDKGWLRAHGIMIGQHHIYMPDLTKHKAIFLLGILWKTAHKHTDAVALPIPGRLSFEVDPSIPKDFYRTIAYPVCGNRAIRVDRLELFSRALHTKAKDGKTIRDSELSALIGCPLDQLDSVVAALGWSVHNENGTVFYKERHRRKISAREASHPSPQSPFAMLQELKSKR